MVGVVVKVGPHAEASLDESKPPAPGDQVFGFCLPLFGSKARAFQEYTTVPIVVLWKGE